QGFSHIDKDCERGEGPHRWEAPAGAKPEVQRHGEKEEQGGQRDDEVGPERADTNADESRQIRAAAWVEREEVLVPDDEDTFRERDRRRAGQHNTADAPRSTDRA